MTSVALAAVKLPLHLLIGRKSVDVCGVVGHKMLFAFIAPHVDTNN